jgi:GTP-binding protein
MSGTTLHARFIGSWPEVGMMPAGVLPEFAFIGRSNVGKSSLINMLCGRKNLAHTSANPGKTQTINLFDINSTWNLADLPGYGYARVSKEKRGAFEAMISNYFLKRSNLYCAFVLVDSRIPPQPIDLEFIRWLGSEGIPLAIIYTKADKKRKQELETNLQAIREALQADWEELPMQFVTSAEDGIGREELVAFMNAAGRKS